MTNIILLGPPGCGKGTQSKILVEKHNFFQISTGDILRKKVHSGSSDGKMLKKIMETGQLVPDELVINIIIESMDQNSGKNIIFDGFPRNLVQAKALDHALLVKELEINFVLLLEVNFDELEKRIQKRVSEANSENQREDDNAQILNKRLEVYKEATLPIIKFYEQKNKLNRINGMMAIDLVSKEINNLIN